MGEKRWGRSWTKGGEVEWDRCYRCYRCYRNYRYYRQKSYNTYNTYSTYNTYQPLYHLQLLQQLPRSSPRDPVNAVLRWFLAGEIAKMNKLSAEDFEAVKSLYFSKKNSSQKENKKNITQNDHFA